MCLTCSYLGVGRADRAGNRRRVPQTVAAPAFRNPVMFVVFVCSILTTGLWAQALAGHGEAPTGFILWVAIWLWFTLLFANFAEAIAEAAARPGCCAARGATRDVLAHRFRHPSGVNR
jgi:K+-transporting ATPase ATPase B chain